MGSEKVQAALRRDLLTGAWVSVATERAGRPVERSSESEYVCPFCAGNEQLTPPELASWNDAQGHWAVRVVNNLFPALSPPPPESTAPAGRDGPHAPGSADMTPVDQLYTTIPAAGAHEVVVEHPRHDMSWNTMPIAHLILVLEAWQARYRYHAAQPAVRYVQLFKNDGQAAGASLRHPHSQLVALPLVPLLVEREIERTREHFSASGRCLVCETVAREREESRLVAMNDHFLAYCPFASRVPYETWVVPCGHQPAFGEMASRELASLAEILRQVAEAQSGAMGGEAFNLILRTAPCDGGAYPFYHWRLEWLPRKGTAGGFEWGTGWFINPVEPEEAAARLRQT